MISNNMEDYYEPSLIQDLFEKLTGLYINLYLYLIEKIGYAINSIARIST